MNDDRKVHYITTNSYLYGYPTFCGQDVREVRAIAIDDTDPAWLTGYEIKSAHYTCPECVSIRHLKVLAEVIL
jgi:hypothetical protein